MTGIKDLTHVWKNLKEVDMRPLQEAALNPVKLAIVGRPGVGRHTLADQLRRDPQRPEDTTETSIMIADTKSSDGFAAADLIILMLDATKSDFRQEEALARQWTDDGKKVLRLVNKIDLVDRQQWAANSTGWLMERALHGSALDPLFLQHELVSAVLEQLPERYLAIGRQFPLFRTELSTRLINETCNANAIYCLSTGVAEVVPIFDIPLNIADMVVLTKAQAFLVYKLGLALGLSTNWQDYLGETGGVIGGGFVWRQIARMLVGLIPVWGIVPKVAVAYAGTYVVGHVVYQWYLTGRRMSAQQMRELYVQALANGKKLAQELSARMPRPRLAWRKTPGENPEQLTPTSS